MNKSFLKLFLSSAIIFTLESPLLASSFNEEKEDSSEKTFTSKNTVQADVRQGTSRSKVASKVKGKEKVKEDEKLEEEQQSSVVLASSTSTDTSLAQKEDDILQHVAISLLENDFQGSSSSTTPSDDSWDFFASLPDQVKPYVVEHLPLEDIGSLLKVSQGGKSFDHVWVWREIAKRFPTDCSKEIHTREDIARQYLRVRINLESDPEVIRQLMTKYEQYNLNKDLPFQEWRETLIKCIGYLGNEQDLKQKSVQGILEGLEKKTIHPNFRPGANEHLLEQQELYAVVEKMCNLAARGDLQSTLKLIQEYTDKEKLEAIARRFFTFIDDYLEGYVDDISDQLKFILNEYLVEQKDPEAIERKIWGYLHEDFGYEKNIEAALRLSEENTQSKRFSAAEREIIELIHRDDHRNEDIEAAWAACEKFFNQGFKGEIINFISRNYDCLVGDTDFGEPYIGNCEKFKSLLSTFVNETESPDLKTHTQLLINLHMAEGSYQRYFIIKESLKLMIERAESEGQAWAYYLKSEGLKYGILGFEQNIESAKVYILTHHISY